MKMIDNRKHIGALVFAMVSAALLSVANYMMNNMPVLTGEDLDQFWVTERIVEWLGIEEKIEGDEFYELNVAYDKALADEYEPRHMARPDSLGKVAVTDRKKLYDYLSVLDSSKQYKYIILDVFFDKNDKTEYDSLLFNLIARMDNIVFAGNENTPDVPGLKERSAHVNWYSTVTATNFTRLELRNDSMVSLPMKVYMDLTGSEGLKHHGRGRLAYYTENGRLCYNSCFLTFDRRAYVIDPISVSDWGDDNTRINYKLNLGKELQCDVEDIPARNEQIVNDTKGKIVVIGDFETDVIDTYCGPKPGTYILTRALQTLMEGGHHVSPWYVISWFIIFFMITYLIVENKTLAYYIPRLRNTKHKFLQFWIDFISYSLVLMVCEIVEYALFKEVHSLLLPILYFSILKHVVMHKEFYYPPVTRAVKYITFRKSKT